MYGMYLYVLVFVMYIAILVCTVCGICHSLCEYILLWTPTAGRHSWNVISYSAYECDGNIT